MSAELFPYMSACLVLGWLSWSHAKQIDKWEWRLAFKLSSVVFWLYLAGDVIANISSLIRWLA